MPRHLKDIEPNEVSFTDLPATKKRFLFFKRDMQRLFEKYQDSPDTHKRKFIIEKKNKKINISIESDGTIKGSKIIVNGEEIKNLQDFHFSFYKPRGGEGKEIAGISPISCSYSKITETEDGFKHSDTFYLSKSEMEVNMMDKDLKELLDSYFGEEVSFDTEEFEKAELSDKALNALKGALNLVNKYKADFPDDLKKAVGVLAKYASYGYGYPAKKKEEEDINKSGKTLSKDTVGKVKNVVKVFNELQSVIKALNELLPEEDQKKLKKSDATEGKDADEEFKDALDEVTNIAKKLEGKLEEKDQTIEKLNKRLETVEKEKGIKKSIDGQDDDDEGKSEKKWGSFGG
ncbi:hypothetical protein ES705_19847 [subsurface metagenome]